MFHKLGIKSMSKSKFAKIWLYQSLLFFVKQFNYNFLLILKKSSYGYDFKISSSKVYFLYLLVVAIPLIKNKCSFKEGMIEYYNTFIFLDKLCIFFLIKINNQLIFLTSLARFEFLFLLIFYKTVKLISRLKYFDNSQCSFYYWRHNKIIIL